MWYRVSLIKRWFFFFLAKRQATFRNHLLTFQTDAVPAPSRSETFDSTTRLSLFINMVFRFFFRIFVQPFYTLRCTTHIMRTSVLCNEILSIVLSCGFIFIATPLERRTYRLAKLLYYKISFATLGPRFMYNKYLQ